MPLLQQKFLHMRSSGLRDNPVAQFFLLLVFYIGTAKVGLMLDAMSGFAALIWPPSGIALAALLLYGNRLWPAITIGAFVVNYSSGAPMLTALGMAVGNTLEAIIGSQFLKHRGFNLGLNRLQDVLGLIFFAALLSSVVSASVGVLCLYLGHVISIEAVGPTWGSWWAGDVLGDLLVAPLILVWLSEEKAVLRKGLSPVISWSEKLAFTLLFAFISSILMSRAPLSAFTAAPLPYLVFPLIIWSAFRFGIRSTITSTFLLCVLAVAFTALGTGPFVRGPLKDGLLALHFFIGGVVVTALILSSTVAERAESSEAANAAKNTFLAHMSHEIRTPLGVVLGFSELLSDRQLSSVDCEQYSLAIKRNGELLTNIINDILDIAKVEAGKLEVDIQKVPLEEVLTDLTTILNLQAQEKGLRLFVKSDGPIPSQIDTDPLRLRQIFINIVGNAIKFTEKGEIEVVIKQIAKSAGSAQLQFTVRDTGPGISSKSVGKLFEPFSQADASRKRKFGGTGLGLVLSKRLANLLGGDVVLSESIPGRGSVFTITIACGSYQSEKLPAHTPISSLSRVLTVSSRNSRLDGVSILLVDDAVDNQRLISQYLKTAGAQVDLANNGQEALDKTQSKKYDALLMDIQMPIMDGYEATAALRKSGYEMPIIALTAHALKEERQKCLSSGFDDHIPKPINKASLIASLNLHCTKPARPGLQP